MTGAAAWQDDNAQYLSASLSWLRELLERLANGVHPETAPASRFIPRRSVRPAPKDAATPAAKRVAELESKMKPPPALVELAERLELSRFERDVLLLCAALEMDTRIGALCARAQDDAGKPYPTFALAMSLFDAPAWDVLSAHRPLRFWRLIEVNAAGGQPLTMSPLRADERTVNYLKGLNYLDDRLVPFVVLMTPPEDRQLPPSHQRLVDEICARLRQPSEPQMPIIQLLGPDPSSKEIVACAAAAAFGRNVYKMSADAPLGQLSDLETVIRLWHRESILLPLALYLDAQEQEGLQESAIQSPMRRFLARSDGFFFLGVREFTARLGRPSIALDVAKPTAAEQREAWGEELGQDPDEDPALLAGQFNLNLAAIYEIAGSALGGHENLPGQSGRLWDGCRNSVRPRLDMLAQRLDCTAKWSELVLPHEEEELLRQIAAQVGSRGKVYGDWGFGKRMSRGLGISALFAGASGTGKTMAAEVIAHDLRLNLYRIDLSAVVSKYIGETEKNLRRLFDAADDGGAILFFDEADALFGKRSEVKDSHDRYANIEVNYLLQRMESYRGLAILATNMKDHLDPAFLRRLRFVVNFSFPGAAERKRIWENVFPPDTPLAHLDYDRLARLNLTGGTIHNAALNAAFLAARASTPVTMSLVLSAARAEFLKLDRPINEADFRSQGSAGAVA